jgi:hypothetical protein
MELAEEMARADGATELGLSVLATNNTAHGLYLSLGYEVLDPQSGPLLRMSKHLSCAPSPTPPANHRDRSQPERGNDHPDQQDPEN